MLLLRHIYLISCQISSALHTTRTSCLIIHLPTLDTSMCPASGTKMKMGVWVPAWDTRTPIVQTSGHSQRILQITWYIWEEACGALLAAHSYRCDHTQQCDTTSLISHIYSRRCRFCSLTHSHRLLWGRCIFYIQLEVIMSISWHKCSMSFC